MLLHKSIKGTSDFIHTNIFSIAFHMVCSAVGFTPGFFLTPPAEKTKTQAKKLKQKTQVKNSTFGRTFPPICKTQEQN